MFVYISNHIFKRSNFGRLLKMEQFSACGVFLFIRFHSPKKSIVIKLYKTLR